MEFAFEKGENITLKLNSEVLGGVRKAVFKTKNSYTDIGSFLTDIPVYRTSETGYTVTLTMDCSADNPFDENIKFESLMVISDGRTVEYTGCTVENAETSIGAAGTIERVVTISADERNVI